MKKIFTLCVVLCMSYLSMGATNLKHEFRATWLTTAWGNDWPKTKVTNATTRKQQQDSLIAIFDRLQAGNMNAVCFQVRGRSDAFYQSSYEPWAAELAGARGKDPGYDPLAFAIEEAHKRGLELHAWVNPFRVTSAGTLDANDLVKKNAGQWIIQYNNGSFTGEIIDPGYPEAREYVLNVLMEIISNYDIDGIVMDDYFYPYGGTTTEDAASKALHKPANVVDVNKDGKTDDDWRRSNVDVFLEELYDRIQAKKPWVRFGMGTFGIWTTQSKVAQAYGIALPSGISGLDDYDEQACNPVEWVKNGYVDYINPQLYWPTTSTGQNYNKLCHWWAKDVCEHFSNQLTNGKKVHFFSSQSISANPTLTEIQSEIDVNRNNLSSGSTGSVFFDTDAYLTMDNALMTSRFATYALPPAMDWKSNTALAAPTNLTVSGSTLTWQHATAERFTVYAYPKGIGVNTATSNPQYLQAVVYDKSFNTSSLGSLDYITIAVYTYDRYGVEHGVALYNADPNATDDPEPEPEPEPEPSNTITWELNGGEVNTSSIEVPSQSDLMLQFMNSYTSYFGTPTSDIDAFYPSNISGFLFRGFQTRGKFVNEMMLDESAGWKWLADYIVSTSASNTSILAALNSGTEVYWRYSIVAFLTASAGTNSTYTVDFSTAGQPSKWGTAYQIAHGAVLLPTYVTSAFTLPTPTHPLGHDFLGWYDNAEFTGSPLTTIPAGWTGTLYAKWNIIDPTWQITYTSSNDSIVTPYATDVFGANIVSNIYENGVGTITFDGPVTTIGNMAFYGCSGLTSITIPNSVTSIGNMAFSGCSGLTYITIPNSVTSIGNSAFSGCSGLTSVVWNAKNVADFSSSSYAPFYDSRSNITSFTFGDNVQHIPAYLCHYMSNLTSITIPNSVTSIGDYAFAYCSGLTSVTIGNSVTSIGTDAFYYCRSLTSITIPNSVTTIGDWAFAYCSGLTSVTIGNSVTSIGEDVFAYCSGLTSITIPESVTSIGNYAFYGCSGLTSITIPESVTSIGNYAFSGCSGLTSVVWNAKNVADFSGSSYAPFNSSRSKITSFTFGDSVQHIPAYLCYEMSNLTSATIPNSVTSIGSGAFYGCTSNKVVINHSALDIVKGSTTHGYVAYYASDVHKEIETIGDFVFAKIDEKDYVVMYLGNDCQITLPANYRGGSYGIGANLFRGNTTANSITISNAVTSIGDYAFYGCSNLNVVYIGNSVISIGTSAFYNCPNLYKVIMLPNSVPTGITSAFQSLSGRITYVGNTNYQSGYSVLGTQRVYTNLNSYFSVDGIVYALVNPSQRTCDIIDCDYSGATTEFSIGNTVVYRNVTLSIDSINSNAFRNNTKMTKMVVDGNHSLPSHMASGCSSIDTLMITSKVGNIGSNAFSNSSKTSDAYYFINNSGNISASAFAECTKLYKLVITDSVKNIGTKAFYSCDGIADADIYNNGEIGSEAFRYSSTLEEATHHLNNKGAINNYAFANCSAITTLAIDTCVGNILQYAFQGCSALENVTIQNNGTIGAYAFESSSTGNPATYVISNTGLINESAFANCTAMKNLTVNSSVTTIDQYAFQNCSALENATIQNNGNIGQYAFQNCSALENVTLQNNGMIGLQAFESSSTKNPATYIISNVGSISESTFANCTAMTNLTIDSCVTTIDQYAFQNCSALENATIQNNGTIGASAFENCTKLQKVRFGNKVGDIYQSAFYNCVVLDSLILPNTVTALGNNAFYNCNNLAFAQLSNTLSTIGNAAFGRCNSLPEVFIPKSVSSIGQGAFNQCTSLSVVGFEDGTSPLSLGRNSANKGLFYDCPLDSVYIGRELSYQKTNAYGYSPFYRSATLRSIVVSDVPAKVETNEFYGCTKLYYVHIGNGVQSIGDYAFSGCSSIDYFSFGSQVKTIGAEAFSDCVAMTRLYSDCQEPPTCGASALEDIDKWNCTLYVPDGTLAAYAGADQWMDFFFVEENSASIPITWQILYTSTDGNIVTPNATDVFGANIVSNTYEDGVGTITFDGPVTSIGNSAFRYCSSLISITIPNSVMSIGDRALSHCTSLTSITIPNSVTSIGFGAFDRCSLISITIPNSVTSIGEIAFRGSEYLESIFVESGNTTYDSRENCNAIIETATNTLIAGCQTTVIPNSVTSIGFGAFDRCSLISITIPNSVTSIGENAFAICDNLTSIIIPNSVTSIGDWAFSYCHSLTSIAIPNSVSSIGYGAFLDCSNLTVITIPNSVTSIGDKAFSSCKSIESIVVESGNTTYDSRNNCNAIIETATNTLISGCQNTIIPNSVTSIGNSAFAICDNLTSIIIPNSVTSIGDWAFADCDSLATVTIGNSVRSIGVYAFRDCFSLDTIYAEATTPPTLGENVFYRTPSPICVIPCGTLATYQSSDWAQYVSEFIEDGCPKITYELNGGITNDHGWMSKDDMYHDLLVDINAIIPTTVVDVDTVTLAYDKTKNIQKGIPTYWWEDLSSLLSHSDFLSKWGWLINYMDSACASESKYLPSTSSVYLRYNLSAFFFEKEYTNWPQTPDYSKYGLYPYYQPAWQHGFANPTNPTDEVYLNAPYKEGYIFDGWYIESNFSGEKVTTVNTETEDTLYAKWIDNKLIDNDRVISYTFANGNGKVVVPNEIDVFGANIIKYTHEDGKGIIIFDGPVTSIGDYAFNRCTGMTSIEIPNSVTSIGNNAFKDCSSLTSITIPNRVTSVGFNAFVSCTSLTSIIVEAGNATYDSRDNCNAIIETASNTLIVGCPNTIIPNGVTNIGNNSFLYCSSITSITIPKSVTTIGRNAFRYCSSLDTIYVEATMPPALEDSTVFMDTPSPTCYIPCGTLAAYQASDWAQYVSEFVEDGCIDPTWQITYTSSNDSIVTPYKTDVFGANIVSNTYENGVGTITFDGPVTTIGDHAFHKCPSLTSITIPNSVTSIGYSTFSFCFSLTSVTIPNSVTSIGDYAFDGCSGLTSITIPSSVTHIGHIAFYYCSSLTSIVVEQGNTIYDSRNNCNAIIETATNTLVAGCQNTMIPNNVTSIGVGAFEGCEELHSINIPNNILKIETYAFFGCSKLISITIPNSVTFIGQNAFGNCDALVSITVDSTNLVYDSRDNCNAIIYTAANHLSAGCQNTIIPNSVTEIGSYAFGDCNSLTSIIIPNSVRLIGGCAFYSCKNLTSITIPNSVTNIAYGAFMDCSELNTIHIESTTPPTLVTGAFTSSPTCYIPCGTLAAYQASDWASQVSEFVEEGCAPVQQCGDNLFWEYEDGVLTITGSGDMYDYAADTDVPWYDVRGNIKTVSLPDAMTKIGDYAFYSCTALTSITLPEQLQHIGNRAFAHCTKITSDIIIPDGVADIADRAFYNCKKVNRFTLLPLTSPTLGEKVFESTSALFYISCEAMEDYNVATNWSSLKSRFRDACLNIYHYNTALGANGVHATEDTLVASIYYRRKFTTSRWETLYLPFEVDRVTVLEEGVEYDLKAWSIFGGGHYYLAKPYGIENKEVVFGFTTELKPNTPYIIQFKDEYYRDKMITFYGSQSWNHLSTSFEALTSSFDMQMAGNTTLQDQTLDQPVYMLRGTSNFILQNATTTLHPFECYVMPYATPSGTPARMNVRFRGDVPTAVESVKGNESHLTYTVDGYTLTVYPQGQAFSIYSLNGALIYSCEAGKEAVDCELNSGCYLLHAGTEAHKIML